MDNVHETMQDACRLPDRYGGISTLDPWISLIIRDRSVSLILSLARVSVVLIITTTIAGWKVPIESLSSNPYRRVDGAPNHTMSMHKRAKTEKISDSLEDLPSPASVITSDSSCIATTTDNSNPMGTIRLEEDHSTFQIDRCQSHAQFIGSPPVKVTKRVDYISWEDYFMGIAVLSGYRSKDPIHPVGACIVDRANRVIGIGYAGFPMGCSDDCLPWIQAKGDGWLLSPAPYVVHAEKNAILNRCVNHNPGARLYTQHFPCNECAKIIVQADIAEVIYMDEPVVEDESIHASRILLQLAGVKIRKFHTDRRFLALDFWQALNSAEREVQKKRVTTKCDQRNGEEIRSNQGREEDGREYSTAEEYQQLLIREIQYDPITTPSSKRRGDVLSWDDYFMAVAFLTAQRSKDPNTQVGACIVDPQTKHILGCGYNGFPARCSDDTLPWSRTGDSPLHTKYLYVCHAEVNAILNKGNANIRGATIYVALFPCNECAKMIIQAGIKEVVYLSDQYHQTDPCRASRVLFEMAGVKTRQFCPAVASLQLRLSNTSDIVLSNPISDRDA